MFKKLNKMSKLMLLIFAAFIVWMTFFDENSFINKNKLENEIKDLQKKTEYYKSEIKKDQKMIGDLNIADSLEKYAREKYLMKKTDEEILLIEFDTINE